MQDGTRGQSALEYILLLLLLALVALAVWATLAGGPAKLAVMLQKTLETRLR